MQLLACVTALVSAQFNQDDNIGQKGGSSLRSTRFQRLPSARPAVPTALANQRIRRPITFRYIEMYIIMRLIYIDDNQTNFNQFQLNS